MDFNIKNILLGTAVILPATMGLSISNADTIQNLTINGSVNFRVAPNVNSTKIDKLKKGQTVEYLWQDQQRVMRSVCSSWKRKNRKALRKQYSIQHRNGN